MAVENVKLEWHPRGVGTTLAGAHRPQPMPYQPPDHAYGPFDAFLTCRVNGGLLDAIRSRAAAGGIDASLLLRRILRAGAALEGIDGLGRPIAPPPPEAMPVVLTETN